MAQALWRTMNDEGFSPLLRSNVLKLNGGFFALTTAMSSPPALIIQESTTPRLHPKAWPPRRPHMTPKSQMRSHTSL